ncbi:MAG: hypothetical protein PHV33_07430 [Elusimicrobiales bacterium]|nr:hypothetical protein [Elusimicrobiales bacterium]
MKTAIKLMSLCLPLLSGGARAADFEALNRLTPSNLAAAAVVPPLPDPPAPVNETFVYDPDSNNLLAEKLDIPVFFALPESAYSPESPAALSGGGFWPFIHPDAANAATPVGLRVYLTPHAGVGARLAASGLVQTGDILLTFRPEWGFQGPYPNIQMGISHAGIAYVEGGYVRNLDNPLSAEYLGRMDARHYMETPALHIIRPRGLSAAQKANLAGWMKMFVSQAPAIYPEQISFNKDYFSPKYTPDLKFVRTAARIALRLDRSSGLDMYCSEFVWAVLALRDCDPARAEEFGREGTPACVKPVFDPLPMVGNYFLDPKAAGGRLGLSDGPLAVISSMGLPEAEKKRVIGEVFKTRRPMSPGHVAAAASIAPYFTRLEDYYSGAQSNSPAAQSIMEAFNAKVKPNYSPTSYLVNALLPTGAVGRRMDVVATVVFSDGGNGR